MLQTCSKCKSQEVSDKTANFYFLLTAILAVISAVLVILSWPWGFLAIALLVICVVLAVCLPSRKYRCKNCGNEWQGDYAPSGEPISKPA